MRKFKLSVDEQIEYLKNKGIKFEIDNIENAKNFLTFNSYFFKLKSYCKNYEKKDDYTYINLDFSYLKELSTLDMYFRRFNLRLTLDLEHMLKSKLLRDFNTNDESDGYEIVKSFINKNPRLKSQLVEYPTKGYTAKDDILKKYNTNLAIWNFIEIIEFGKFINFSDYYYDNYPNKTYTEIKNLLWSIKCIRNSSAHNNCLLHKLKPLSHNDFKRNTKMTSFLKENIKVSSKNIEKKMQIPTIHDFIATLIVYKKISTSEKMNKAFYKDLFNLIKRFKKNKNYFIKNTMLTSNFSYIIKVIIFLKKI